MLTLAVIFVVIYSIMVIPAISVVKNVKEVFLGNVDIADTVTKPIDRYNINYYSEHEHTKKKITIIPLFALHNFKDGHIWVVYSFVAKNDDGEILTASDIVLTKWQIHYENREWEITGIEEAP